MAGNAGLVPTYPAVIPGVLKLSRGIIINGGGADNAARTRGIAGTIPPPVYANGKNYLAFLNFFAGMCVFYTIYRFTTITHSILH